jgi:hypothetical protein
MKVTQLRVKNANRLLDDDGDLLLWVSHPNNVEIFTTPKAQDNDVKTHTMSSGGIKVNFQDIELVVSPK